MRPRLLLLKKLQLMQELWQQPKLRLSPRPRQLLTPLLKPRLPEPRPNSKPTQTQKLSLQPRLWRTQGLML